MSKVYAYTITRADTPPRCKLLLQTLTEGRKTAGYDFDWHVHVNGDILARDVVRSCKATGIINSFMLGGENQGQHPPTNRAHEWAIQEGYTHVLRLDDDVEFLTKRWLAKMMEASLAQPKFVISPQVKGLRWQPPQTQQVEVEGIPVKFIEGPIGGICRLIPTALLQEKPYVSDVRWPMGGGDAMGVGKWAITTEPIFFPVYLQHVRVRHAKSTDGQVAEDPAHFNQHSLFQHVPYIPVAVPKPYGRGV